jgi:hypothetical protein
MSTESEFKDINENSGVITYIMLGRVYDMLLLVADSLGKGEDALNLRQLHSQGQLMCPLPSLVGEEDNNE